MRPKKIGKSCTLVQHKMEHRRENRKKQFKRAKHVHRAKGMAPHVRVPVVRS